MSLQTIYDRVGKRNIHGWTSAVLAIECAVEAHPEQAADWAAAFEVVSRNLCEELASLAELAEEAEQDGESASSVSA
ncbi:MAG: hypothetical protein LIO78_06845 [Clostridiales bacterium]|nr:hypothetical protein [Clostridiales bacterium]